MYQLKNYIVRGLVFANNTIFPSHKKLSTIMLYATDKCNAHCRHCFIWNKKPIEFMSLELIKKIVNNKSVSKSTLIGLEGGEFILHPEYQEIIKYLSVNHPNFDLLSNCVEVEKLIEIVKLYPPKRLYISLDGNPEIHDSIRGVKGLHEKVLKIIDNLKDIVPISVMFTLTPFNSFDDLKHVAKICSENKIDMRIGIYNNMEYFDTKKNALEEHNSLDYQIQDIPEEVKLFAENYDFMVLYRNYRDGYVKLSCSSVKDSIVIYPNGDIPLCQNKQIVLGNLHKEPLDVIINKKSTLQIHKEYKQCNSCWVNFHRKYDIVLHRGLERFLGKRIVQLFLGTYSWAKNTSLSYKQVVK